MYIPIQIKNIIYNYLLQLSVSKVNEDIKSLCRSVVIDPRDICNILVIIYYGSSSLYVKNLLDDENEDKIDIKLCIVHKICAFCRKSSFECKCDTI